MKYRFLVGLFWFLMGSFLFAQENMTLEKAISIGLENNYNIQIAEKYIEIAENNNTWARAGKNPTIDLNGSFTNVLVNDNNEASFLQGTYYSGALGGSVDAAWVVYSGGRVKISKEQLSKAVDQQTLNQRTDIHNLLRNIYQHYYDVIFQKEQLLVLETNLNLSRDRLEYESTKRQFGASNSYNMIQFENAIISDSTSLVAQKQLIEIAKRNLYNTLDISGFSNYTFQENLSTIPEEIDIDKLREILSEENYTLKSLEMLASINQLNTVLAQSARKPTITLTGSLGLSENGFKFFADNPNTGEPFGFLLSNRFNGSINANINWNLYDGGVRKTDIQNAKLQEEIDQLSMMEAKAEIQNQLEILVSNYNNQRALLDLADQQIQIANKNLEMTKERFKAGQLSSLDFRNVQTQALNAAFNKVAALYNLIITKSEIDFLVGRFE